MRPDSDTVEFRDNMYQDYLYTQVFQNRGGLDFDVELAKNRLRRQLLPLVSVSGNTRALDIGCGHGVWVSVLRDAGAQLCLGIDRSPDQAQLAKSLGIEDILEGDAIDYLDGCAQNFDLVSMIDFIEHLRKSELPHLLDQVYSVLEPGGTLLLRTPNASSPFGAKRRYDDFTHEVSFTPKSIRQVLMTSGFESIEVHPTRPDPHGLKSRIRAASWQAIEYCLKGYLAIETGEVRGHVLTQNLIAVARKQ